MISVFSKILERQCVLKRHCYIFIHREAVIMETKSEYFLDEIFELEAYGMFDDIKLSSFMIPFLMDFDEIRHKKAIDYITNVLKDYYSAGYLKVYISHEATTMLGYALWFINPAHEATYLHKIFVHEKYRNHGIGTGIMKSMCEISDNINLLCPSDKVEFYQRNGFRYIAPFEIPDNESFKLSKYLYSGLSVMTNSETAMEAPIFFLNDNDLKAIVGVN